MLSSILYKQLNYTFARTLYKRHVSKLFDNQPDNVYKAK